MKKIQIVAAALGASVLLTSCDVIADIFQAGMAIGVVLVIVVVALIIWLVRKVRR